MEEDSITVPVPRNKNRIALRMFQMNRNTQAMIEEAILLFQWWVNPLITPPQTY
jgi:hypothetical protein